MLDERFLEIAHKWEWSGRKLNAFALKFGIPEGTLRRGLMEYRDIRRLESPYTAIRRELRRLIRRDPRVTVDDALKYIFLHLGLMLTPDAIALKMDRIRIHVLKGKQQKLKLDVEVVRRKTTPIYFIPKQDPQMELFHVRSGSTQVNSEV
jgi:hypothetical protein